MTSMIGASTVGNTLYQSQKQDTGIADSASKIKSLAGKVNPQQADKIAKDFESMFLSQMVENMFGDSEGDSQFGDADSGDIYKGMMVQNYGKAITDSGGIGIAAYIKRELLKSQEVSNATPSPVSTKPV